MGFFSHIGLGFVDDAISGAGKLIGGAAEAVGGALKSVGDFVVDTVDKAIHDPVGTILKIAAVATGNPELIPLIDGANTYAKTGDIGKAFESAAVSYVTAEVANGIVDEIGAPDVSSVLKDTADVAGESAGDVAGLSADQVGALPKVDADAFNSTKLLKAAGQGATKGAISAGIRDVLSGKGLNLEDISKGALSGGVGAGAGNTLSQYGYNPIISGAGAGAAGSGTSALLNHRDVGDALLMGGVSGGAGGATSMLTSGKDENGNPLYSPTEKGAISGAVQGATGALLRHKDPITGALINAAGGAAEGATSDLTGNSNVNRLLSGLAGGAARYGTADLLGKTNVSPNAKSPLQMQSLSAQPQSTVPINSIQKPNNPQTAETTPSFLSGQKESVANNLYGMPQIQSPTNSVYGETAESNPMQATGLSSMLSSATPVNNPAPQLTFQEVASMYPQLQGQLADYPQLENVDPRILLSLMESGGNKTSLYKNGGIVAMKNGGALPKAPVFITGATGHYVKGHGDGQSDDIPAMLADGEYVFDADTVASLGNGSSDAGAKLLDHFREALREHKRSAPNDKIPPPAAPLQYMKQAIKRHGVSTMTKG